ncbi:hypothetical protein F5J12DRAFT_810192 [Pisolithus orientalis]|uniref:uncharacterized protein n=1 Tax=Pisolithus orientalis TaxID=936130 RepID=UPI0022244763|nr:uncharacterized protein F5J12DRAFT_810192 [Pisolithus orientalis]KAI6025751.1 hypothetical protein F5J12DRAFT_810192 [Pisolithus orientalis]
MSDKYTDDKMRPSANTSRTGNYPPQGDTTSSGGYGASNTFSPRIQRGVDVFADSDNSASTHPATTAIQQSTTGTDLSGEMQDAQQGVDRDARAAFQERPGGRSLRGGDDGASLDSREEAEAALRDRYALSGVMPESD